MHTISQGNVRAVHGDQGPEGHNRVGTNRIRRTEMFHYIHNNGVLAFKRDSDGGIKILVERNVAGAAPLAEIDIDVGGFDPDLTEVRSANGNLAIVDIKVSNPYLG